MLKLKESKQLVLASVFDVCLTPAFCEFVFYVVSTCAGFTLDSPIDTPVTELTVTFMWHITFFFSSGQ